MKQTFITDYYKALKMKQTLITDYYKALKVYGYNIKTNNWNCLICGEKMGINNPRQFCGKSRCDNMN
jgi:hypothetical protein